MKSESGFSLAIASQPLQEIYSFSELLSQRTKADLGCNIPPRDEDDKDFIVAFPAEQERQYDNLGGARSFFASI